MTADQWQEIGIFVLGMGGALWRRRKQNDDLAADHEVSNTKLEGSIAKLLTDRVGRVEAATKSLENRIAVHATELNHTNQMTKDMRVDVAKLQAALPDIKEVLHKTLDFFERQKAKTLEAHSVGQGMTAITSRKKE